MYADALDEPHLRRLIAVGHAFLQDLSFESLQSRIVLAARDLCGARYAALGILDEDRTGLATLLVRGTDAASWLRSLRTSFEVDPLRRLVEDRHPLRLDEAADPAGSVDGSRASPPARSFLGIPIAVRGTPWGVLGLTRHDRRPFDAADEAALVVLAEWAGLAVENAQAHETARRRRDELEGTDQVLSATTSIVTAMGTATELDRVLELIVQRGRELVGARTMFISLPQDDVLEIAAAAGDQGRDLPGTRVPLRGSTGGQVLRDGRSRRMPAEQLSVSPEQLGLGNVRDCLLVPLVFRERRLGVLVALDCAQTSDGFSRDDEELLRSFAASAANAVATAQNVTESRLRDAVESAEQERRRWARELHDETLQALAGLQVRLSIAEQQCADTVTSGRVREVLDDLGREIRKLRTLITELRPAALDELGLGPALESLVDAVVASSDLEIDLQVALRAGPLAPETETAVYRLMQEALTNVIKHAHAKRCVAEVTCDDEALSIVVRDDGRGIDPAANGGHRGFGVTGMRERARLAGGTLTLGPGRDGGTALRARLPLPPTPRATVGAEASS